jgi:hypothetical protein
MITTKSKVNKAEKHTEETRKEISEPSKLVGILGLNEKITVNVGRKTKEMTAADALIYSAQASEKLSDLQERLTSMKDPSSESNASIKKAEEDLVNLNLVVNAATAIKNRRTGAGFNTSRLEEKIEKAKENALKQEDELTTLKNARNGLITKINNEINNTQNNLAAYDAALDKKFGSVRREGLVKILPVIKAMTDPTSIKAIDEGVSERLSSGGDLYTNYVEPLEKALHNHDFKSVKHILSAMSATIHKEQYESLYALAEVYSAETTPVKFLGWNTQRVNKRYGNLSETQMANFQKELATFTAYLALSRMAAAMYGALGDKISAEDFNLNTWSAISKQLKDYEATFDKAYSKHVFSSMHVTGFGQQHGSVTGQRSGSGTRNQERPTVQIVETNDGWVDYARTYVNEHKWAKDALSPELKERLKEGNLDETEKLGIWRLVTLRWMEVTQTKDLPSITEINDIKTLQQASGMSNLLLQRYLRSYESIAVGIGLTEDQKKFVNTLPQGRDFSDPVFRAYYSVTADTEDIWKKLQSYKKNGKPKQDDIIPDPMMATLRKEGREETTSSPQPAEAAKAAPKSKQSKTDSTTPAFKSDNQQGKK